MSDYITAATIFANSSNDHRMLGFISKGRKNYLVYETNQEDEYDNPFNRKKLKVLARTPRLLDALEELQILAKKYHVPIEMRIVVDVYIHGFPCGLYIKEFDAEGNKIRGYFSKYGREVANSPGYLSEYDLKYPLVLRGGENNDA